MLFPKDLEAQHKAMIAELARANKKAEEAEAARDHQFKESEAKQNEIVAALVERNSKELRDLKELSEQKEQRMEELELTLKQSSQKHQAELEEAVADAAAQATKRAEELELSLKELQERHRCAPERKGNPHPRRSCENFTESCLAIFSWNPAFKYLCRQSD